MTKWLKQKLDWCGSSNPKWRGGKNHYSCEQCGKDIERYAREVDGHKHIFCSSQCHDDFRRKPKTTTPIAEMHHERHPRWTGAKYCKTCGAELRERKERRRGYCSDACLSKQRSQRISGEGNPRWKGGHVYCRQCGIEILRHSRLRAAFCSRQCMWQWQSENLSRENSHMWQGGSSYIEYPPVFNYAFRLKIRERDGFTCQRCGVFTKGDHLKRGLDVHHIDGNKKNCAPSNLISLCSSCHRKVHWELRRKGKRTEDL